MIGLCAENSELVLYFMENPVLMPSSVSGILSILCIVSIGPNMNITYSSFILQMSLFNSYALSDYKSVKVGLKLNIQKTKIMASGPITSWEIDGETVETVADFIFLGSKITADGD